MTSGAIIPWLGLDSYVVMSGEPFWLAELGLGIGRAEVEIDGWEREWLFWFSESGERYPVPEEYQRYRAEVAEQEAEEAGSRAEQQRLEAEQAEQQLQQERQVRLEVEERAEALTERLRTMGIDPNSL